MKKIKFLVVILAVVVSASSLAACGNNSFYKYADEWTPNEKDIQPIHKEATEKYTIVEEVDIDPYLEGGYIANLSSIKDIIRIYLEQYDFLNWENLKNVKFFRIDKKKGFTSKERVNMAFYDRDTNSILLVPEFFNQVFPEEKVFIVLHALLHVLFSADKQSTPTLEEELVDHYAEYIYDNECPESYLVDYFSTREVFAIEVLFAFYGEEEVLKLCLNNQFEEKIDAATKEGMGKKLEDICNMIKYDKPVSETENIELDILAHMVTEDTKNVFEMGLTNLMSSIEYPSDIDSDYIYKLLE